MAVRIATGQSVTFADNAKWDWTPVTQTRSLSFYWRPRATDGTFVVFHYLTTSGVTRAVIYHNRVDNVLLCLIQDSGGTPVGWFSCPFTPINGRWYHIAFVASTDGNCKIYVDGVSQSVTHTSWDDTTALTPDTIGITPGDTTNGLDIAHWKWWNSAISSTYVSNDKANPWLYDSDANCITSVHFTDATGTTAYDAVASSATNGTLNSATWTDNPDGLSIHYVGGKTAGSAGSTGGADSVAINSGLSGGSNDAPIAGDLVVVTLCIGTAGRTPDCAISGYTPLTVQRTSATTYDTNVQTSYKVMTASPDTTVSIQQSEHIQDGRAYSIQIFRGIDTTNPLDVTSTYNTGSGTDNLPDPAAITPATVGSWIVVCGGGAAQTGGTYTASYLTDFLTSNGADTNDANVGCGYVPGRTSGEYDPAAFSGGSASANNSWGATTIALRPVYPARGVSISDSVSCTSSTSISLEEVVSPRTLSVSETTDISETLAQKLEPLVVSKSDELSQTEILSQKVEPLTVSKSDTVSLEDSPAARRDHSLSTSDSVANTEIISQKVEPLIVSEKDSVATTETPAQKVDPLLISAYDAVTGTEALAQKLEPLLVSGSDTVAETDAISQKIEPLIVSESDEVSETELPSQKIEPLIISTSDSASVTETSSASIPLSETLEISKSDTTGITESATLQRDHSLSASDTISVQDEPLTWSEWADLEFTTYEPDRLSVSEWISATLEMLDISVSVSDSVSTQDSISAKLDFLAVSESESVSASESVTALVGELPVSAQDQSAITDSASASLDVLNVYESDTGTITEASSIALDKLLVSEADSPSVTESVSTALDKILVSLSDSVSTLEVISASVGELSVSTQDQTTITDSVSASLNVLLVSESESIGTTESVAAQLDKIIVSLSDSIDTVEVVQRSIEDQATRTVEESDQATVTESITISADRMVAESDQASVAENVSIALDKLVTTRSDSPSITEYVTIQLERLVISLNDTISKLDYIYSSLGAQEPNVIQVNDSVSVQESKSLLLDKVLVSTSDSIRAEESPSASLSLIIVSVRDTIDTLETISRFIEDQATRMIDLQDSAGISESVSSTLDVLVVSVQDLASATEELNRSLSGGSTQADQASVLESTSAMLDVLNVVQQESVAVSDAAYSAMDIISISVSDTIMASDGISVISGKAPTVPSCPVYSMIGC